MTPENKAVSLSLKDNVVALTPNDKAASLSLKDNVVADPKGQSSKFVLKG